jgi:hypothetical protein
MSVHGALAFLSEYFILQWLFEFHSLLNVLDISSNGSEWATGICTIPMHESTDLTPRGQICTCWSSLTGFESSIIAPKTCAQRAFPTA